MPDTRVESALIVAGGNSPGNERLRQLAGRYQILIAADGGLAALRRAQLWPTFVTGDFDSVSPEDLESTPPDIRVYNPDQSATDLEKAILLALEEGVHTIALTAAGGDRMDHTINAVSLMLRYSDRAVILYHDAGGDGELVRPPGITVAGRPGDRLSLVPAPKAESVISSGLKYPLVGLDLGFGSRDGISNELLSESARIELASGSLLLYRQIA